MKPLRNSAATANGILYLNQAVVFTNSGARLTYREIETNGYPNFNLRRGSLRFWFQPLSSPGSASRLFEVGTKGDTTNGYWTLYLNSSTNMIFESHNGTSGGVNLNTNLNLAIGTWYHFALTWNSNACVLWTNGVIAQSNAASVYYPPLHTRANGLTLGNDASGQNPANGKFDALETFNYPLSESEITNHFYYTRPMTLVSGQWLWLKADAEVTVQTSGFIGVTKWVIRAAMTLILLRLRIITVRSLRAMWSMACRWSALMESRIS